jgi:hypothetical protein
LVAIVIPGPAVLRDPSARRAGIKLQVASWAKEGEIGKRREERTEMIGWPGYRS